MTTVVFSCCQPCKTGSCGVDCHHEERDGMTFASADEALATQHDGCMCVAVPRDEWLARIPTTCDVRLLGRPGESGLAYDRVLLRVSGPWFNVESAMTPDAAEKLADDLKREAKRARRESEIQSPRKVRVLPDNPRTRTTVIR